MGDPAVRSSGLFLEMSKSSLFPGTVGQCGEGGYK